MCLSACLSGCVPARLPCQGPDLFYLSDLFACLSIYLSVGLSVCLSGLFVFLWIYLSVLPLFFRPIWSICPPVYLFTWSDLGKVARLPFGLLEPLVITCCDMRLCHACAVSSNPAGATLNLHRSTYASTFLTNQFICMVYPSVCFSVHLFVYLADRSSVWSRQAI